MSLNFNVEPYYDDFDQTKNFHRILFKPGVAVQARELTQSQTILQDQITKFADNIFKQNSPVTGGQITTNLDCHYVKLQSTYNNANIDVTKFNNLLVKNSTGTVVARVIAVVAATVDSVTGLEVDPATLILSYKTGSHFVDNDTVYDVNSNLAAKSIISSSTGQSSVASISDGVFYVLGNFVQIQNSTIVLSKYSNTPSRRIGLNITETIYDYINDSSLLDPAIGASNYQAPGADRYVISLALDSRPLDFGDDDSFIELTRVVNGEISNLVNGSVYNVIDDYFAKRDYETNGDYIVNDFKLTPRTTPVATDPSANTYILSVGKGLAYVHGYRTEVPQNIDLISNRARTQASENNSPIFFDYGSYFYVNTLRGTSSFFDVTTAQSIDIHCVDTANIRTTNAATYSSTLVASGYVRNISYNGATNDADANTYIYKLSVNDLQQSVATANAIAGGTNTITLPGTYAIANDAYVGVNISITSGPSAGDFRTITAYNGATRVATVNQNWTTTPTTASVFALNFDVKDAEQIVSATKSSYPATITSQAKISTTGKVGGISTGDTKLYNSTVPEQIYNLGSPFVGSIANTAYTTQQMTRGLVFTYSGGAAQAQLNYEGSYSGILQHFGPGGANPLSADIVKQNYVVVVTDKGASNFNTGDIIPFANTANAYVTLDGDSSIATLYVKNTDKGSAVGGSFTATVLEKVYVKNGINDSYILKYKNLIQASTSSIDYGTAVTGSATTYVNDTSLTSTGQVYIQNAGLVAAGQKQSLYLSDVKRIVKIIDTKASGTTPILSMLSNTAFDITNNYTFDNGQRDSYYEHASITLKPGAPQPDGNILVLVDYYQHTGGQGYFSLTSYLASSLKESYTSIPTYTAKNGNVYYLRDCMDYRPARQNKTTTFQYKYNDIGDGRYGALLPSDLTVGNIDYSFYLGRKDKLVLTKDGKFNVVEGSPSLNPLLPGEPDGSLVIANITHDPYTAFIPTEVSIGSTSNLSIEKVKHKRYTMQDIAGLENRINQIEYFTSMSLLEQKATTLQIPDAFGINRFKNGVLVDDFSNFSSSDTKNLDFNANINRRDRTLSAAQSVKNFPLKATSLVNNMDKIDPSISLGYKINSDGFTHTFSLPYTTANAISQKFASREVSVNQFTYINKDGILTLSPNVDNWVDTRHNPSLLINDPNLQVFQQSSTSKLLAFTDWKSIPGTTYTQATSSGSLIASSNYEKLSQSSYYGAYDNIGNTYNINNGYITDISILPYIRPQQIAVRGKNMLYFASVNTYFDGTNVDKYFRKANIIELTNVTGTFKEDDVVGYYTGGTFYPTGRVLGVFKYIGTNNVRLYVAADSFASSYDGSTGSIRNAVFNQSGSYTTYTASGTYSSSSHFGGMVQSSNTAIIKLSGTAPSTNNYYGTGANTVYIVSGSGVGQSATIQAYYAANQTLSLSTTLSVANGDIYSIGSVTTSDHGSVYGVFCLPENVFLNGQRIFRIDNSNGSSGSETTFAQSTFYADGLQSISQKLDFGAAPSGTTAQNPINVTNTVSVSSLNNSWNPIAQTFIVDKDNYPNGLFLNSVKFFFSGKPTTDESPISLCITGTLNGYPNQEILQNSVVSLNPNEVNANSTPQYLDAATYTTFNFDVPVYIQSGVLYSFVLKSNSNEYKMWAAATGDTALKSSTKNLPSDAPPAIATKIGVAPYVGSLFLPQNAQTWVADQNQALMFVVDRCVFNTSSATVSFTVPKKLPERTLVEQSLQFANNANTLYGTVDIIHNTDIAVDAFNITTTDFIPTDANISYSYEAKLTNGSSAGSQVVIPGKYGTPTQSDIYLNDNKGQRALIANSTTPFTFTATLSTIDNAVSPMISDSGLSVFAITWDINNGELSNSLITLASGGSGYNANTTYVTVSQPDSIANGVQATATANIVGGVIKSVWLTSNGSGYLSTPTVTVTDTSGSPGSGASILINGETSKNGGNITAKYLTRKVTLEDGFDSGDLNVYMTAYRPVNTDIHVYYKILNRNDTQVFDDGVWQLMTKINNTGSKYSQTRTDVIEYVFAPGTNGSGQGYVEYTSASNSQKYNSFNQFAIKIVFTSKDHTYTPFVDDIRVIALPENVNLTV